jgi:hypothetical protein
MQSCLELKYAPNRQERCDMCACEYRYFQDCEQAIGQVPDFLFPACPAQFLAVAMHSVDAAVEEMLESLKVR